MCSFLRVYGLVQGVGFRPYVARVARQHGFSGHVRNLGSHVEIVLFGVTGYVADQFADVLRTSAPPAAAISRVTVTSELIEQLEPLPEGFSIIQSSKSGDAAITVPPDIAVCDECLSEMSNPQDRRFGYAFINCTNCGPRFSIVQDLPYDRSSTTMKSFRMCDECAREYYDADDRRFHAQPNACPQCGPQLALYNSAATIVETDDPVSEVIAALLAGKIVAVKSIGGFHLAVNAADGTAIKRLRQLKKRDNKPFAVMARDVDQIHTFAVVSAFEERLLKSPAAPIVLLKKLGVGLPYEIAPKNPNIGVMLPSAPLHHLLLRDPRLPVLVMTSGNISSHPIVIDNETALSELTTIADLVLLNNRDIETMVDDSVVRCSTDPVNGDEYLTFFRRGRGYAPYSIEVNLPDADILGLGAELKTTVSVRSGRQVVMGQHIGDVKNDRVMSAHRRSSTHLSGLLSCDPGIVACDAHPAFRSTRDALASESKRVRTVFHHHAHMAACMLENALDGECIGVIFDGAGYGADGTIWGAEFLTGGYSSVDRAASLRPIRLLGGDQAVKHPIRTAIALLEASFDAHREFPAVPAIAGLPDEQRDFLARMWRSGVNSPECSSMGRLFDGVAALLGMAPEAEYEAQGPIEMEGLLKRDLTMSSGHYPFELVRKEARFEVDYGPVVRGVAQDIADETAQAEISRKFHSTIVRMVCEVCCAIGDRVNSNNVVLSGGVFLNEFLLVNTIRELRHQGFHPYHHTFFPSNDGGISAGQIAVAAWAESRAG
ncbi:hypothetical protein WJ50_13585 [Burkholderia ubonensis]|nr:hypothetical protein WJ49_23455 [Burkholderia ubonensis]KVL73341.1 hypothetical protein WJ48_01150 [Burkholderia ubonensis]KVL91144.1 hypothetical protein WJ50_13585 [Burkholderia ubonensis]